MLVNRIMSCFFAISCLSPFCQQRLHRKLFWSMRFVKFLLHRAARKRKENEEENSCPIYGHQNISAIRFVNQCMRCIFCPCHHLFRRQALRFLHGQGWQFLFVFNSCNFAGTFHCHSTHILRKITKRPSLGGAGSALHMGPGFAHRFHFTLSLRGAPNFCLFGQCPAWNCALLPGLTGSSRYSVETIYWYVRTEPGYY